MSQTTKVCTRCQVEKLLADFYMRRPYHEPDNPPSLPGHYVSECKTCMIERSRSAVRLPDSEPRTMTEILAMNYLRSKGILSLPGKAVSAADVDVVAFGHVWIEVKYSKLKVSYRTPEFVFTASPAQMERGYLAHVVMLICDHETYQTYHLFDAHDPVLYIKGRVKSGMTWRPGRVKAAKHAANRVVMTQSMMDAAQDDVALIWRTLLKLSEQAKQECR